MRLAFSSMANALPVGHLGDNVYSVGGIVTHRVQEGQLQYLVNWEGYSSADWTWETAEDISDDVLR